RDPARGCDRPRAPRAADPRRLRRQERAHVEARGDRGQAPRGRRNRQRRHQGDGRVGPSVPIPRSRRIAAFLAVYLIWGSTFVAIRWAIEIVPAFLMAAARFTLAGVLLYLWSAPRETAPTARQWRSAAIAGALLFGSNGAVTWGVGRMHSGGLASLLIATV